MNPHPQDEHLQQQMEQAGELLSHAAGHCEMLACAGSRRGSEFWEGKDEQR